MLQFWKRKISNNFCKLLQWLTFVSQISSTNEQFSIHGFRNYRFQDKDSEMDPKLSSCCDFLLKLLFLVRTIKDIGGAVREPPGLLIAPLWIPFASWGVPFFEAFFGPPFSHTKSQFWRNMAPKINNFGIIFLCFWGVCFKIVFWSSWGRFWGRFGVHFGIKIGPKST